MPVKTVELPSYEIEKKSQEQQLDDNVKMIPFIKLCESPTKCQTITFIMNNSDELP